MAAEKAVRLSCDMEQREALQARRLSCDMEQRGALQARRLSCDTEQREALHPRFYKRQHPVLMLISNSNAI